MIESFVAAARLPQTGRDHAAAIAKAESQATLAVLERLGDGDWQRPTDCTEWDVRALVSHLVAQFEDSVNLRTMLRRRSLGRRRYPDKDTLDAHMAVQVDDHAGKSGPALVEQFALLWPRAVKARRGTPALVRWVKVSPGIAGAPRMSLGYMVDILFTRDLWMHRVDLAQAVGQPLVTGDHDRHIVEQIVRDLALGWDSAPIALELTGAAGGCWLLGSGDPVATVRADAVAYMRALSGRDDNVAVELVSGDASGLAAARAARVIF